MRILDFHTHPFRPAELAPATREFVRRVSPTVREHEDRLTDPAYAAGLLRADGVVAAVVLAEHCPSTSGNVRTETVLQHCAAVPDFYLPFASVDVNTDETPAALLESYIRAGARGLKLYPSYQFYHLDDQRLYPLYELCQAHTLPVLIHIGSSVIPGTRVRYSDPLPLDDVAVDFPELALVMAHGGRGLWYRECAFLARHHRNVYIDVSGLVPARLPEHFPGLEKLADRIVFGSDWPAMPKSPGHNARVIAGLGLPEGAVRKILHDNAARILGLSGEEQRT